MKQVFPFGKNWQTACLEISWTLFHYISHHSTSRNFLLNRASTAVHTWFYTSASFLSIVMCFRYLHQRRGRRLSLWPLPNRGEKKYEWIPLAVEGAHQWPPATIQPHLHSHSGSLLFIIGKRNNLVDLKIFSYTVCFFSAFPSFCKHRDLFFWRKWEWQGPHFISSLQEHIHMSLEEVYLRLLPMSNNASSLMNLGHTNWCQNQCDVSLLRKTYNMLSIFHSFPH